MSRFVKSLDEIIEACPTSRWRNEEKLMSAIADEELTLLQPILGETLMDYLEQCSNEMRDKFGTLVDVESSQFDEDVENGNKNKRTIELLSQVRKAVIYRMLANNTEILSVSLNEGGGHNRMETEQYDSMSMNDLSVLSKKYYHKSIDRIETILILLEKDAKSTTPIFCEKWNECEEYFYLHGDLLFPTLHSIRHYYNIGDERIKYAELCQDIRFCQQTYIAPSIGEELVSYLIKCENDNSISSNNKPIINKAIVKVRTALSLYIQARTNKNDRQLYLESADMAKAQMCKYIAEHQSAFGNAIINSPLYTREETENFPEKCVKKDYRNFSTLGRSLRRY